MKFKPPTKRGKADDAVALLGNKAFEPPVGAKTAFRQLTRIRTRIGIADMLCEPSGELGDCSHIIGRSVAYLHACSYHDVRKRALPMTSVIDRSRAGHWT
jgi:hypothetical protein